MDNKVKIKVLPTSDAFKLLDVSGNSGDVLNKHQVNIDALLLVKAGNIIYADDTGQQRLKAGEFMNIPPNVIHKVTCTDTANFFVVLPSFSKMKFEK